MRRKMATCTLALTTLMMASVTFAQRQWTVTGQEVPEMAAIDDMVHNQMVTYGIRAASVAITKDGRLVYARGYTWDRPEVEPVQPTSLFRVGSIAKSITSIAIHQLIEEGLLSYDTRVAEVLDLEPLSRETADPWLRLVTVDHLLTHTVGWDNDYGGIDPLVFGDVIVALANGEPPPPTRHEIARFMTGQPFQFYPGTHWGYCNFGYLLLQMLAEKVTGRDFPEYVHDRLFRAVGVGRARMAHTLRPDLAPTERDYDGVSEGDPYQLTVENAYAAGGIVLSAPDLARLYSALFDDPGASGLLGAAALHDMLALPFASSRELGYGRGWIHEKFFSATGHTMGWFTDPDDRVEVYGHGGGGPGMHAIAAWRSDGIGFFWLTDKDPLVENFDDLPVIESWPEHDLWESVGISRAPVGAAPVESWVPAVAHTSGVADSAWRSDVGLLNRSSRSNTVRIRYHQGVVATDLEVVLGPHELEVLADVVGAFGDEGSGPLQVFSSEGLTVTSRTYNQSTEGTYGQSLDGVTATGGLESGESAVLMHLREDATSRTNIGLHNQWRRWAKVEVALYDGTGSPVTKARRLIPAQSTVQLNRPFAVLGGRDDVDSGYAVVTVLSGQDVYAHASVIDNLTGDPTAIPMKTGEGSTLQWIAAAVHGEGASASRWRTDLGVLNRSGGPATAEIAFHAASGAVGTNLVTLGDGEQLIIEDVVAALGLEGSGTIAVAAERPLMISSRTYNSSEHGTFGLFLDGISPSGTASAGETVWLSQLQQNDLFRTNIGLVNTGSTAARARITLVDGSGADLESRWRTLGPGAWLQLQEPFARIAGRTDIDAGYARIEVAAGEGVIGYASVIDNATNDGTAVAMKH